LRLVIALISGMALARAVIPVKGISGDGSNHAGSICIPAISPPYRPVSIFEERFSEDNALLPEKILGISVQRYQRYGYIANLRALGEAGSDDLSSFNAETIRGEIEARQRPLSTEGY
jgi:hypothetical protein